MIIALLGKGYNEKVLNIATLSCHSHTQRRDVCVKIVHSSALSAPLPTQPSVPVPTLRVPVPRPHIRETHPPRALSKHWSKFKFLPNYRIFFSKFYKYFAILSLNKELSWPSGWVCAPCVISFCDVVHHSRSASQDTVRVVARATGFPLTSGDWEIKWDFIYFMNKSLFFCY